MSEDPAWLDLASALSAARTGEVRAEAAELRTLEASRSRLADRRGPAVLRLVGGRTLAGTLVASEVDGWLTVVRDDGAACLVRAAAVLLIQGSAAELRPSDSDAAGRSIGSWVRERCDAGESVRAVLVDGDVVRGRPALVGADHAELRDDGRPIAVPWSAVVVWDVLP